MVYRRGMDPILLIYGTRRYRSAGDPSIATGRITVTTASLSPDTAMQASLYEDGGGLQGMRSLAVERGIASASVPAGRYTLEVSITGENVQGVENPAVGRSMPTHTATFTTPVVVTAGSEHAFVVSSSGISAALVATTETIGVVNVAVCVGIERPTAGFSTPCTFSPVIETSSV
jgi:hypothetical protein